MMSIRNMSAIILACLMTVNLVSAASQERGISENILNFMNIFNGFFYSSDQDKIIKTRVVPVDLPDLGPEPKLLVEGAYNGSVHVLNLCVITERGNIIYMTPYNVTTDPSQFKFEEFNTDSLSNLKREDLHTEETCTVAFFQQKNGGFVGDWPDCKHFLLGQHPTYAASITCDSIIVTVPIGTNETKRLVPYQENHSGERFPVKGAPDDYVSPCENM